jgi:hypothetical protein
MRKLHFVLILLASLLLGSHTFQADPEELTVEQASKKGLIKLTIKGKGGYTGEVIEMKIKNLFAKKFKLKMPAGHRLDSKDSTTQDILVTRPEEFILASKEEKTIIISGMCCQAHNHSPNDKSQFRIGKMADSLLIKLAQFINTNKLHKSYVAQHAVWVISDNNRMESITGGDTKEEDKMVQEFVSKLTDKPMPLYTVDYSSQDSGAVFSGRPKEIKGSIEYYLTSNAPVTCGAYSQKGKLVQQFFVNLPQDTGTHKYDYTFNVANLPPGTYLIRVYSEGQLKKENKVEI